MAQKVFKAENLHAFLNFIKERTDDAEKDNLLDRFIDRCLDVGLDHPGFDTLLGPEASTGNGSGSLPSRTRSPVTQQRSGASESAASSNEVVKHGASAPRTAPGPAKSAAVSAKMTPAALRLGSKEDLRSATKPTAKPTTKPTTKLTSQPMPKVASSKGMTKSAAGKVSSVTSGDAKIQAKSLRAVPEAASEKASTSAKANAGFVLGETAGEEGAKRGRGRPKNVPKYPENLRCLSLMDSYDVTDERTRAILTQIASAALNEGGSRGIPMTEGPDNYLIERRGGPQPMPRTYTINGEQHVVVPPIVAKGAGKETNAMWIEFEMALLGIADRKYSESETQKKQNNIALSPGVKNSGINWVEGKLTDGSSGVPTIHAETARDILRLLPGVESLGPNFIDRGPASWVTPEGDFTDAFAVFMRDVWYKKLSFGRREKFALARLLMEPIGGIERKIQEVAFDERFEDKELMAEKKKAANAAALEAGKKPRGRPKGSTKAAKIEALAAAAAAGAAGEAVKGKAQAEKPVYSSKGAKPTKPQAGANKAKPKAKQDEDVGLGGKSILAKIIASKATTKASGKAASAKAASAKAAPAKSSSAK